MNSRAGEWPQAGRPGPGDMSESLHLIHRLEPGLGGPRGRGRGRGATGAGMGF